MFLSFSDGFNVSVSSQKKFLCLYLGERPCNIVNRALLNPNNFCCCFNFAAAAVVVVHPDE